MADLADFTAGQKVRSMRRRQVVMEVVNVLPLLTPPMIECRNQSSGVVSRFWPTDLQILEPVGDQP